MSEWKEIKLKEVAKYWVGKVASNELSAANYISTDNMITDKGGIIESRYVPVSGNSNSFTKNDVLVSNIRPYFKKIWFADKDGGCSNDVIVFRAEENIIDPLYLYYQLSKDDFFDYMMAGANGTKMPRGNRASILEYKFFLPPLHTQKKIAYILSAYDKLIANNFLRIKLLEETALLTFNEWFGKVDDLPKGWERRKLKDVADINKNQIAKGFKGTIKYVDISSVSTGNIDSYTEYKIEDAPGRARRVVKHGDIIWSCVRPNRKSYCPIWNPETNLIASTGFAVITPKDLPTSYLYQHLTTEAFVGYLTSRAGGAAYPAVKPEAFEEAEIIVPSKEKVEAFDKIIKPTFELRANLVKQNRLLKESRDILLPRLMNGTISVEKAEAKVVSIAQPKQKEATWEFKEAVLISMLTEKFGNEKFPLGRKRYTKLSYLFHRHADNQMQNYLRKAAGPYNPKTKYAGPEKIAHQNGYVADHKNGNLTGFIAGKNISAAKTYFENYWSIDYLNWLDTNFHYKSNDQLELYATVDNAMVELHEKNKPFNVEAVKTIIKTEKEWKAKLEREIFSDANIQKAINYLPTLFQYENS